MAKETEEMEINQIMEVEDPIDVVKLDLFEDDDEFEDFEFDLGILDFHPMRVFSGFLLLLFMTPLLLLKCQWLLKCSSYTPGKYSY